MSDAGPSRIVGSIDIKILLAFVFAVVFALALLVFTTFVRDPSEAAVWTYKVILALAAAGFAAVLPGFLDVRYKGVVQAGGALAVFVVVLLLYPAGGRSQGGPGREGVVPKGDAALDSTTETNADGEIKRSEDIDLNVAAIVTDVLPNGNLMIRGSQEVRVNYELRVLTIAGMVRPSDIGAENTIPYERIAEARIAYGGRGRVSEVQQPAYGQQVLDQVLPF